MLESNLIFKSFFSQIDQKAYGVLKEVVIEVFVQMQQELQILIP
jgi:hypothetical protein